jgi:hypothetical protein
LHSSNSASLLIAAVFALGAILFAVGTSMVRRSPGGARRLERIDSGPVGTVLVQPPWTSELTGANDAVAHDLRVDMIERLAMIGEPWCIAVLERARSQDPDASVRDAAEAALLVIGARSPR